YAGITGALLTSHGFEAHDGIIEAREGLIDGWQTDATDVSALTAGLGLKFSVMQAGFKYYSAGYPIHSPLYGALSLMQEHHLSADEIARVRVGMAPGSADVVDGRAMSSISLHAMMSLGMILGRLGYDDAHDQTALERPDVQRLRSRIEIVRDET